jgi:membrane-associated phospholipid phosphatase
MPLSPLRALRGKGCDLFCERRFLQWYAILAFQRQVLYNLSMRIPLNAVDRLSLFFLALLTAVVVFNIAFLASWPELIIKYALLASAIVCLAAIRGRAPESRLVRYFHAALAVTTVLMIFNSLGDVIPAARQRYYDDLLIRIDFLLFGVHPTVWMERFNDALLTAVLQIAYISYYFMPIALGIVLLVRKRYDAFDTAVFAVLLCFYLSYIGYFLVPAVGPRFTMNHLQTTELRAGSITLWIQQTLNSAEHNKTDAFPSGHTAVSLVSLYYAWKFRERILSLILAPMVAALIVSTVYLRYHYVIDVIAGVLLAVMTVLISPPVERLFSRKRLRT